MTTLIDNHIDSIGYQLTEKLDELGSRLEIEKISIGPQTIRFSMVAADGVQIRTLSRLKDELAYELGCPVAILAPVPGEKVVGIEIPNPLRDIVRLDQFESNLDNLVLPLGIDSQGIPRYVDLRDQPHILIGGTTGSGKSNYLNSIICYLISNSSPVDLQLCLIDPKMVEFTIYNDIPHLGWDIVNDVYETPKVFRAIISMMEDRYRLACKLGARNLKELNEKSNTHFPYFVCIVDEMADMIMVMKKEIEEYIVRIAQKSRAVGIHLMFATQSPRREICTGILKANLPSRIAFSTSSPLDSRIILDKNGAESLLGDGDMLFSSQGRDPERFQAPFISTQEIETIVRLVK